MWLVLALAVTAPSDSTTALCETWCRDMDADTQWCKCRACNFARAPLPLGAACEYHETAACSTSIDNDTPFETCSKWCSAKYTDAHCSMCACKTCAYCTAAIAGRQSCQSFQPRADSEYERCDGFCDARYAAVHCSMCRCRGCGYCANVAMCDPTARDDCTCEPETDKDSHLMGCAPFCKSKSHCSLCKCAGCAPLCTKKWLPSGPPPPPRPPRPPPPPPSSHPSPPPGRRSPPPPSPSHPSPYPPDAGWPSAPSPPPGFGGAALHAGPAARDGAGGAAAEPLPTFPIYAAPTFDTAITAAVAVGGTLALALLALLLRCIVQQRHAVHSAVDDDDDDESEPGGRSSRRCGARPGPAGARASGGARSMVRVLLEQQGRGFGGRRGEPCELLELGSFERAHVCRLASASDLRSEVIQLLIELGEDEENLDEAFKLGRDDEVRMECVGRRGGVTPLGPRVIPSELVRSGALQWVRVRVEQRGRRE